MKIILLKDLHRVGRKYEVVDVADGYALNSLIPAKIAEQATDAVVARYAKMKDVEEAGRAAREEALVTELGTLAEKTFEMTAKANEQGHLFAAIHREEVAAVVGIDTQYIHIPQPIKEVGTHEIEIKVKDVVQKVVLTVNAK